MTGAPPAAAPRGRLEALTGLRWLAALGVFTVHFRGFLLVADADATRGSLIGQALTALTRRPVGVSCFFVLSGFVLAWSARPDDTARRFWRRRLARVYPLHLLTTVTTVTTVFFGLAAASAPGWRVVLTHLLLVQSWTLSPRYCLALNAVTWSLSCVVFFYLCFPALYTVLSRLRTTGLRITAAGSIAAIWVLPPLAGRAFTLVHGPDHASPGGAFVWRFAYFFPGMRLLEFVIGMVAALLVRRGGWRGPGVAVSALGCIVLYAVDTWMDGFETLVAVMVVPLALVITATALRDIREQRSPLRSRALVRLGAVSYAFYASHYLLLALAANTMRPVLAHHRLSWPEILGLYTGALACCVLAAWGLHHGVEKPLTRRLSPATRRRGSVSVPGCGLGEARGSRRSWSAVPGPWRTGRARSRRGRRG